MALPAHAQEGGTTDGAQIADAAFLDAAVTAHQSAADFTRTNLADLLDRDDVRQVAEDRGIDLERVASAASTLTDDEASAMAPLVERTIEAVRQRGTITIGVTTLIIILLILILVT
jgi:hypothetical protein